MKIIPAIDIIGGKCVRLSKGDYATQKIYNEHPLEVAKAFEGAGLKYLHLVDLDGAKTSRIVNHSVLELLASKTRLHIDFGGGIKSEADVKIAFASGARQITVGSIASRNPPLMLEWIRSYGADRIILGADCQNRKVATGGWLESTDLDVVSFISDYERKGAAHCIVTDIEKDGMLSGPSFELYREILSGSGIALYASGGITGTGDLRQLKKMGCHGAIIGKAIYEGTIHLNDLIDLC